MLKEVETLRENLKKSTNAITPKSPFILRNNFGVTAINNL